MKLGVEMMFEWVNDEGGIDGRQVELIAYDDGYEPLNTITNMRRLINRDRVIAVVGNVGTPTATVSVPIANESKTLLFGAYSGAELLRRDPPDRYVINYRASYEEETCAVIGYLSQLKLIDISDIAFFTQADAYGDSGFVSSVAALSRLTGADYTNVEHAEYQRNTLDVEGALATLLECHPPPRAVVLVGAGAPCAKFIRLARENRFNPVFWSLSFVGDDSFAADSGDGVFTTRVVPHPRSNVPIVMEYRRCLQDYGGNAKPSHISLEGFIVGRIFVEGLRRAGGDVNRESIIDALESFHDVDVGLGFPISFSSEDHQASHRVWATVVENGRTRELDVSGTSDQARGGK